jgi:hypothetical protein
MRSGQRPTTVELARLRLIAKNALVGDTSDILSSVDDALAVAAGEILTRSKGAVQTVIMGHTHLAREVTPRSNAALFPEDWRDRIELAQQEGTEHRALYINTGTWADRVRVDVEKLEDDDYLVGFLQDLIDDVRPRLVAHFGEVVVASTGEVIHARLVEDVEA